MHVCKPRPLVVWLALAVAAGVSVAAAPAQDPNDPPAITQQPQSQTACAGSDVTLTVTATGVDLSYQWRKDDEAISGANSDTLVLTAVTPTDSGSYDVVVSNPFGYVVSDAATVLVDPGPQIVEQPAGDEVCPGASFTLTVTLANQGTTQEDTVGGSNNSGSGARLRGNYYRVDTATTLTRIEQYIDVTTAGTLVFFVYEADNYSGPYALIAQDTVTNAGTGAGFVSSNALAVPLAAGHYYIIGAGWSNAYGYTWSYTQPEATSFGSALAGFALNWTDPLPDPPPANTNGAAYLQRLTTSDLALTYQWRKNDEDIPGAASSSYTIAEMSAGDAADYDVVVTSTCGSVTSEPATVTLAQGATITGDPNDYDGCTGDALVLVVTADGPDLSYQWRKDGVDLPGETNPYLLLPALDPNDAGSYDAVVTNACGSVTSAAATVTVSDQPPAITAQPEDQAGCTAAPLVLGVAAEGSNLRYQWRKDGADIPDATGEQYVVAAPSSADAGVYTVVVLNGCGSIESAPATVTIDEPVAITQQPAGALVCTGEPVTFSVAADGTNIAYQWRKDGADIPGATSDTYALAAATLDDAGTYDVVLSNPCGDVTSTSAVLSVAPGPAILTQPADRHLRVGDPLELTVELDPNAFPVDVDTIGTPTMSNTGPRLRGNSYSVSTTTTLVEIEQYLDIATPTPLTFFVYESTESEQGPYTLILEDTVGAPASGAGFHASNPIDVTLVAGRYYIIGAAWSGDYTYTWGGAHPQGAAFGETVHGLATPYTGSLPQQPVPTSANVYYQRLTTVDRSATYQWRKNGVEIDGATDATLTIPAVTLSDTGHYDVVITGGCGSVTSDTASVTVTAAPAPSDTETAPPPAEPPAPEPLVPGP